MRRKYGTARAVPESLETRPLEARPHSPATPRARPPLAPTPRAIARLPLVAALVPDPDVWRVSGAGRTLVARRRADGRVAWASLAFDLKRPEETRLFGSLHSDEGAFEEVLEALFAIDDAPPMVGGSEGLAARFARGALARARDPGAPPATEPDLLAVFDRVPGSAREAFEGEEGLCPPELLEACRAEAEADLGPGQGLAVHVALAFRVPGSGRLRASLARDDDFAPESAGTLAWRPTSFGARTAGWVHFADDGHEVIEAESVSLDLAGRLCARIKRHADGAAVLVRLERRPPRD